MGRKFKYAKTENQYSGQSAKPKYMIIEFLPEQEGELIYNGEEQFPTWRNLDPLKVLITGERSAVTAGEHSIFVTPTGNFAWSDNTQRTVEVKYIIKRKAITVIPSQKGSLTYNRSAQTPAWNNFNASELVISGEYRDKINADTYLAYFTPDSNHCWSDGTFAAKGVRWEIKMLALVKPTLLNNSFTFNGEMQEPTVQNFNALYMEKDDNIREKDAGNYAMLIRLTDMNCWWEGQSSSDVILPWKIAKLEVPVFEQSRTATYPTVAVTNGAEWNSGILNAAPTLKENQAIFNKHCYFVTEENGSRVAFDVNSALDSSAFNLNYFEADLTYCLKDKVNTVWASGGNANRTLRCRIQAIKIDLIPFKMSAVHETFDSKTENTNHAVKVMTEDLDQDQAGLIIEAKIDGTVQPRFDANEHFDWSAVERYVEYWDYLFDFEDRTDYSDLDYFGGCLLTLKQGLPETIFYIENYSPSSWGYSYKLCHIKFQMPTFYRKGNYQIPLSSVQGKSIEEIALDILKLGASQELIDCGMYLGYDYFSAPNIATFEVTLARPYKVGAWPFTLTLKENVRNKIALVRNPAGSSDGSMTEYFSYVWCILT